MTYTPTTWVNGGAPGIDKDQLQRIDDGVAKALNDLVPVGVPLMWPSDTLPASGYFVWADGTSYDTTAEAGMFAVMGYTFGGSGANFNVPDLMGRMVLGKAAAGTGSTLGETGGAIDHTHGGSHTHAPGTLAIVAHPDHTHAGAAHTHSTPAHAHGIAQHSHSVSSGTDSQGSHGHSTGSSTSNVSPKTGTSSSFTVAGTGHGHTVYSNGSHSHNCSGTAGTAGATSTSTDGASTTGAASAANTGAPSASLTHPITGATAADGASDAANPPYLVLNFMIRRS